LPSETKKELKMTVKDIVYFDEPGPSHTDEILKMAVERIEELGINHVVIASASGATAKRFLEITRNKKNNIVAVTNVKGGKLLVSILYNKYPESKRLREDYTNKGITHFDASISDETRQEFEKKGVKVHYVPDILNIGEPWGLDDKKLPEREEQWRQRRAQLSPFIPGHIRPLDIAAGMDLSLLNIISMGFRVLVGVTAVAAKNGLIPDGETVLSIAGTGFAGGGADTAAILQARANPKACLVKEIIGFPKMK
jgi:hypothetical protein